MGGIRFRLNRTLLRILLVALLLVLIAQGVLVYIGMAYTGNINQSIADKRSLNVLDQYQQSTLYQLNDLNNLLQLLQTPEFSDFFKSNNKLRSPGVVLPEEQALRDKLNELNLSPDLVKEIDFIGANHNEYSLRKITGNFEFTPMSHVYMDLIQYADMALMLQSRHDQIAKYTGAELKAQFKTGSKLLSRDDVKGLTAFVDNIRNRLVISNGNENGVLILLVLNDRFFTQGLPAKLPGHTNFTVLGADNQVLWSTAGRPELLRAIAAGDRSFVLGGAAYTSTYKMVAPYQTKIVFTVDSIGRDLPRSALFARMTLLSLATIVLALLISLPYLIYVFKPYRMIANFLKEHSLHQEINLREIPEEAIRRGFHYVSLRNKLILLLALIVIIPTISDGLLYAKFSNSAVQNQMNASLQDISGFTVADIQSRIRYMNDVIKGLSVSQTFQNYLTTRYERDQLPSDATNITLSSFPGLSDVSYFVLLDQDGNAIYSSIFSNNLDLFLTDPAYLKHRGDPYWISEYTDVFSHTTTAVVIRMPHPSGGTANYLLLVPKLSVLEDTGATLDNTNYGVLDTSGHTIYQTQAFPSGAQDAPLQYSQPIPGTTWRLAMNYSDYQLIDKNRQYQNQFYLIVFIVFLLSIAAAATISEILVRPIKHLRQTMHWAGQGDFSHTVDYDNPNEIGEIIRSYNRMIRQLRQQIQDNMQMMEENANNKIRENDLLAMKTQAELQMLQAQINPHFLYNTLEAIHMRSRKYGHEDISVMVSALADLFRYSISPGQDMVELEQEIVHVHNYIQIQQVRFGHNFDYQVDVPKELRRMKVVRFILQPIVENAIKHGFEGWEEGGLIRIHAVREGGMLRLEVSDNGNGMNAQSLERLNEEIKRDYGDWSGKEGGIGLNNVYHRLRLVYQDRMEMKVSGGLMKGVTVTMIFPA